MLLLTYFYWQMTLSIILLLAYHTKEMSLIHLKGSDFRLTFDFKFDFFDILLIQIGQILILFRNLFISILCILIQSPRGIFFGIPNTLITHISKSLS